MRVLEPGTDEPHAGTKSRRQRDLAAGTIADRLGGVLHQIQKDLHELIAVRQHGRQRGIIVLDEFDVTGDARLREPLHMIEHDVDIDRFALDRPLVGEDFHAIDKLHDAIGLVADQPRQGAILIADRLLEQLRGAANSRTADF